jgi:hypothetical protein
METKEDRLRAFVAGKGYSARSLAASIPNNPISAFSLAKWLGGRIQNYHLDDLIQYLVQNEGLDPMWYYTGNQGPSITTPSNAHGGVRGIVTSVGDNLEKKKKVLPPGQICRIINYLIESFESGNAVSNSDVGRLIDAL